jgi:multiple sugar transport system substrate-binding protein
MRKKYSRRRFLQAAGASLAGASLLGAAGCGGSGSSGSSSRDMWKQFSGTTLNFVSENTAPTTAIAANLNSFKELTGINVNVLQLELGALVQKVALDIGSGEGAYQVVYADPYQIMAPYHEALADLNEFDADDDLPSIPKGTDDFIPTQLAAAGRFGDEENLYALPYDCPTMIWMYRKDLFDKYGDQMSQDLGFDPQPSPSLTWEQYYKIANWFNENQDEVPYGTGHQARQYDSLMCDFSNILWSYGGDYFHSKEIGSLGTTDPGPSTLDEPKALEAAEFYEKLLSIAHPGSVSWDWNATDEAFRTEQVAMVPNWHEFAAVDQDPAESTIVGKIGYSPLPKGPVRNANMWGGTGVGINGASPIEEQKAAWLFLVWATSPDTMLMGLKSDVGGGTPTRGSLYELPEVKKAMEPPTNLPNLLTYDAVSEAWKPENIGLRPKIQSWNECDTALYTEVSKMLAGQKTPEQAMKTAKQYFDEAQARVENLASRPSGVA